MTCLKISVRMINEKEINTLIGFNCFKLHVITGMKMFQYHIHPHKIYSAQQYNNVHITMCKYCVLRQLGKEIHEKNDNLFCYTSILIQVAQFTQTIFVLSLNI